MLTLLKLVQSLVKALHSEGTPFQVAVGVALGAAWGLTPLMNLHNLVIALGVLFFSVSIGGAMLGWLVFTPVDFLLDPVFDRIGSRLLLDSPGLTGFWASLYNTPLVPYTNFNNTVVLGSVVSWVVLFVPILLLARWGVAEYRRRWGARVEQSRFMQAVKASRVYNTYKLFRPS